MDKKQTQKPVQVNTQKQQLNQQQISLEKQPQHLKQQLLNNQLNQQQPRIPQYKSFFKTPFSCTAIRFNPLQPNLLVVGTSDNFGIVGKGKILVLQMPQNKIGGQMQQVNILQENDAIFDITWSEHHPNIVLIEIKIIQLHQILSGCGDGTIKIWNFKQPGPGSVQSILGHKYEVYSVECSYKDPNVFITSSADSNIKLWNLQLKKCLSNYKDHTGVVFKLNWHPRNPKMFVSGGSDGILRVWDINNSIKPIMKFQAHQNQILTCEFNKYQPIVATGSIDSTIRIWDLRRTNKGPLKIWKNHRYAVKALKFSPHHANILLSGSYDMDVKLWDMNDQLNPNKYTYKNHTEFVIGVDFSMFNQKQIASIGWDGRVLVWNYDDFQPKI